MEDGNGESRFPFPFNPYPIQERFMEALYIVLEQGKVGIFESPTGTGKSLSLICGALTWLKDFEEKKRQEAAKLLEHTVSASADELMNPDTNSRWRRTKDEDGNAVQAEEKGSSVNGELDWISEFVQKRAEREMVNKIKDEEIKRKRREERLEMIRHNAQLKYTMKRKTSDNSEAEKLLQFSKQDVDAEDGPDEDDGLVVADYESDEEATAKNRCVCVFVCMSLSALTFMLIYLFILRLCEDDDDDDDLEEEHVARLGSVQMINDRCMELQKNKHGNPSKVESEPKRRRGAAKPTCPFSGYEKMMTMRDEVLASVRDIEQLVQHGRDTHTCPYYSTRLAIPAAQVVVLPYQSLLHAATRKASGIKLKDQIVVIDEAHNLTDTITALHSSEVNGAQMEETGRVLSNLCNVVPGGVVCFFPSYEYERRILGHWESTGVLQRLTTKKKIFQEPKKASQVEQVLSEYSRCIQPHLAGRSPGKALIENLCMKAVNQSIGRAIRHRGDYACIVLCDRRYARTGTLQKLPEWIRSSTRTQSSFGPAFASIRKFFLDKRQTQP
ncbi:ATP-dependent DNA helicase DDX11 [Bagarius yarrelli]|uniref:ATP-dependent DNA helicase DDX11 n=1 Tax=Bagarius yarrelli TaxID=175774 RepID=A0A556U148_BAGYA|nr:ATP-dependent DNA helicase DDX11 [Bagarius yarrelli]